MKPLSRESVETAVSVVLRVPSLFILDVWYNFKFEKHALLSDKSNLRDVIYYAVAVGCLIMSFLPLERLVNLYMYIVTTLLMLLAHALSVRYVSHELQHWDDLSVENSLVNLIYQGLICMTVSCILQIKDWKLYLCLVYTLPIVARVAYFIPSDGIQMVQSICSGFVLLLGLFFVLGKIGLILDTVWSGVNYAYTVINVYGHISLVTTLWKTYCMSYQFLLLWISLFLMDLLYLQRAIKIVNLSSIQASIYVFFMSMANTCKSPVSLLGLCITVAYVSSLILSATKVYLEGWSKYRQDRNADISGMTEAITVFLLCLQTDIASMKVPTERAIIMSIILFIVLSTLVESIYQIADPVLLSLAAQHSKNIFKHIRALALCLFLLIFPLATTYAVCQVFSLDLWLMVIISSSLLTSIQVAGSLVVYAFFLYDSMRLEPWEGLDDYVYYARAVTRTAEFVVAVLVVGYGLKETIFGEWSLLNFSILCIHFYFNVWQKMQQGWKSFLLRKEAVQKVQSLKEATSEQLEIHSDVCPICYQDMAAARITKCNHYFHELCLRKWLYVQDRCPICHNNITLKESQDQEPQPLPDANIHQGDQDMFQQFNVGHQHDASDNNNFNFQEGDGAIGQSSSHDHEHTNIQSNIENTYRDGNTLDDTDNNN